MKPKLLILDDSKLILGVLEETVRENNLFEPYCAASYKEAKTLIDHHHFKAAILDLELPDSSDAEHVDYILNMDIPSIILSGTYNEKLKKKVSKKAVIDYIVKGSIETVYKAVEMVENTFLYRNKRALVVDDSVLARTQLKNHLKTLGFFVQEADSAKFALKIMRKQAPFDLVTVDYEMPEMRGTELIKEIRKNKIEYKTVFMGVTGNVSDEINIEFLKSGAYDTFHKPLKKELFNIKIANAFSHINNQAELKKSEHVFNEYIKAMDNATISSKGDWEGKITYASKAFCELSGYSAEELVGQPHSILRHPQTPKETFLDMWSTIKSGELWSGLLQNRKKNGDSFFITLSIVPLKDKNENIVEYLSFRSDVTELVHSKKELQKQFYTDSLTSLGNRNRLLDDIKAYKKPLLVIIHFNDFKQINSFYGEEIGDSIIKKFAQKTFELFSKEGYLVYRFGGVDFALLRELDALEAESFSSIQENFNSIQESLNVINNNSVEVQGEQITFSICAGISYDSRNTAYADMAMKIARREKKVAVIFEDSLKISQEYRDNIQWTEKIRRALKSDDILSYYQPIINNATGKVEKYESLVRLRDEDGKIISPFFFLDIAKKSGLYSQITLRVIKNTFEKFQDGSVDFSLNLTVDDILNDDVRTYLIANLKNIQNKETNAVLELVESVGIESFEEVRAFIIEIKSYGAKLAIDDFGTGYSNFEYLLQLDPDYIKIDGSLIKEIDTNKHMYDIVETITKFSHQQGFKVVAEFVASKSIQETVDKLGIECSQGYFHSEPKPELA